jgi:tetratricopeptide (TPR) repeat protein
LPLPPVQPDARDSEELQQLKHAYDLQLQGKLPPAVEVYEKLTQEGTNSYRCWFNLALCYESLGQSEKAESAVRSSIEINRLNSDSFLLMSQIQKKLGKITESKAAYQRYLQLSPAQSSGNRS